MLAGQVAVAAAFAFSLSLSHAAKATTSGTASAAAMKRTRGLADIDVLSVCVVRSSTAHTTAGHAVPPSRRPRDARPDVAQQEAPREPVASVDAAGRRAD